MAIGDAPQLNTEPTQTLELKEKINLRILYAEDNALIRDFLLKLLKERYSVVESVTNGKLLMEKLMTPGISYDCVLADNDMPLKTGLEALKEIREIEKLKNLPVIMLTGDFDPYGRLKTNVLKLGANAYIEKPPKEEELYEIIERLTQKPEPVE